MEIGLRQFDARTVQWLIGAVKDPDAIRSSLAREGRFREPDASAMDTTG